MLGYKPLMQSETLEATVNPIIPQVETRSELSWRRIKLGLRLHLCRVYRQGQPRVLFFKLPFRHRYLKSKGQLAHSLLRNHHTSLIPLRFWVTSVACLGFKTLIEKESYLLTLLPQKTAWQSHWNQINTLGAAADAILQFQADPGARVYGPTLPWTPVNIFLEVPW